MKSLLIISTICTVLFGACKKEVTDSDSEFTLGIGVYSYQQDTIDTKIFIDGKEYFNQDVICTSIVPNVREIKATIKQGTHKIRVESLDKTAVFEKEFELTNEKMWGMFEFNRKDTTQNEEHYYIFYISKEELFYI